MFANPPAYDSPVLSPTIVTELLQKDWILSYGSRQNNYDGALHGMQPENQLEGSQLKSVFTWQSWIVCAIGAYTTFFIVLRPTFWECLVVFVVDLLMMLPLFPVEHNFFTRSFPLVKNFFPTVNLNAIAKLGNDDARKLYRDLMAFPRRRALFIVQISLVKNFIPIMLMIFWWQHDGPTWYQAAKVYLCNFLFYAYAYAIIVVEKEITVARLLQVIHQACSWEEIFRSEPIPFRYERSEIFSICVLWMFVLALQSLVLFDDGIDQVAKGSIIFAVGTAGLMLVTRIWFLGRRKNDSALNNMSVSLRDFHPVTGQTLALHPTPILANFGKTFNQLVMRIREYDSELSTWVSRRSEQERISVVGQLSSLVIHDLLPPLQVARHCLSELQERASTELSPRDSELIGRIDECTSRSMDMVQALRSYLKASSHGDSGGTRTDVPEALAAVQEILRIQFYHDDFNAIKFSTEQVGSAQLLSMTRTDFMHCLLNLYSNAIKNLLGAKIDNPAITTTLRYSSTDVLIDITDNGTGLTPELFERLTGYGVAGADSVSCGLRLTRRLVEASNGRLEVVEKSSNKGQGQSQSVSGTTMRLTLPVIPSLTALPTNHIDEPEESSEYGDTPSNFIGVGEDIPNYI